MYGSTVRNLSKPLICVMLQETNAMRIAATLSNVIWFVSCVYEAYQKYRSSNTINKGYKQCLKTCDITQDLNIAMSTRPTCSACSHPSHSPLSLSLTLSFLLSIVYTLSPSLSQSPSTCMPFPCSCTFTASPPGSHNTCAPVSIVLKEQVNDLIFENINVNSCCTFK